MAMSKLPRVWGYFDTNFNFNIKCILKRRSVKEAPVMDAELKILHEIFFYFFFGQEKQVFLLKNVYLRLFILVITKIKRFNHRVVLKLNKKLKKTS